MLSPLRTAAIAAILAGTLLAPTATSAAPPAVMRVTIDIRSIGHGDEAATPANIAVRAGGTVTITFRNHTRLFHTFTVSRLGMSILLPPRRSTSVTFVASYGVYKWHCLLCATKAHPHVHAMRGSVYAIINA
jgi:plastocyanin